MQLEEFNQADQYPHPITQVQWRETHISCLVLTGSWVYKIKKPMDFGFLNFSTLELRKHYCEEEVRLNQRTAPDLYINVEPLYQDEGGYNFCGRGEVVDYAVKMRQFDPDSLLKTVMPELLHDDTFFQSLGYQLAAFHERADATSEDQDFGNAESVKYPVEENFHQMLDRLEIAEDIARLQSLKYWGQDQCNRLGEVFDQRKAAGLIRECHGDLHLANIALIDGNPVMFDCIEFNERFRWIDVASDLAFLLMDMMFNGYHAQANVLLNSYLEYSADYELLKVLNFYIVYRAMVRAKVAVLKMEQETDDAAQQSLELFRSHVDFAMDIIEKQARYLALTCGVSGSGKSTLARQLAAKSGAIHLRSDVVRKQIAGLKPLQSSSDLDPNNPEALYSQDYTEKTFARLQELTSFTLNCGYPVIVDATFLKASVRDQFVHLDGLDVPVHILYFSAPVEVLKERLKHRSQAGNDASEADVAVMEQQVKNFEAFSAEEQKVVLTMPQDMGAGEGIGESDGALDEIVQLLLRTK